jgi:deoxyribonuclease IV
MLPDGRRLGAHLPLSSGMLKTIDRAVAIGADALQIFTDNPTAWRRRASPPRELDAFRARLAARDITPVSIHASYLINLPGPDEITYERSIELLALELRGAPAYGARFVNVHIGSHRGTGVEAGIDRLVDGIEAALRRADEPADDSPREDEQPTLVLENSAGGGGGLGTSVDELTAVAGRLESRGIGRDRVAFCIDTAHAWGAGIDMGDPDAIDAFLDDFDRRIGLDRVVMVHLNDTRSGLGSRTDRHEHLGAGRIGSAGLGHVLRHPGLAHAPAIIETPGMDVGYDKVNLDRARALAAGEDLDALPAEAFDLAGSARGRGAGTGGAARGTTKGAATPGTARSRTAPS